LLFSDDEDFLQNLRAAAGQANRKIIRKRDATAAPGTFQLIKPAVVLIDLELTSGAVWETADMLLQNAGSPPLLLLSSRSDQADFKGAIEAGLLTDKCEPPNRLLELIETELEFTGHERLQRRAMQQLIIRWLKPCVWSPETVPLHRFWGINE
jgi:DNA-binding response OmpR family regulator